MLGLKVSWVGQTFTLPRCSASRENKPRTRRTKEERRTMVESFIKKYQSLNNGKFPSLNLTHKEVGGSFYTAREIVRDIIQENKVLGPGNPSSKVLNLEYSSGEEAHKGSFADVQSNTSVSTIGHGIDLQYEVDSKVKKPEVSSEENTAAIKPVAQLLNKSHQNESSSGRVMNGKPRLQDYSSNGMVLHEQLVNAGAKESNFQTITVEKDGACGGAEQINTLVRFNITEDTGIESVKQPVSVYHTVSETSLVESEVKNEDSNNKTSEATCSLEKSSVASETAVLESLEGTCKSFTDTVNDEVYSSVKHENGGVFPFVVEALDQDSSSEKAVDTSVSKASQIFRFVDEVHLPSDDPFGRGAVINNAEVETRGLTRTSSMSKTFSSPNTVFVASTPFEKEPKTNNTEHLEISSYSESKIDVAEDNSMDNLVSQILRSPESGTTENDIHLVDKSSSLADATKGSGNHSSKLLEPHIRAADRSKLKAEKRSDYFSSANGGSFMSPSNEKATESEKLETNPMWAAIKAFVSSFFKFWSE